MISRKIGKRELEVSAVGLGCMGLSQSYPPFPDKEEAVCFLHKAVEMGQTFYDTSELYGIYRNEELLGETFSDCRHDIVLATKFGWDIRDGKLCGLDSSPSAIRKAVEGSLRRLRTDYIELYYQHRIDPDVPAEEVAGVMSELIQEGKILNWGISEADEEYLRKAHAVCPVTCIQNRYSMMARWFENLFPVLEELDIGYVAFSPLANGILTDAFGKGSSFAKGDYRNFMPQYQDDAFDANRELLDFIRKLAEEKQVTPAQISLAWMTNKKPYIVPIPGSRKIERIKENAGAADIVLTAGEVAAIDMKLDKMDMSGVFGGSPAKK